MSPEAIRNFIEKNAAGSYSQEEHEQFMEWVRTAPLEDVEELITYYQAIAPPTGETADHSELIGQLEMALNQYDKIVSLPSNQTKAVRTARLRSMWKRWAVAASILVAVGIGSYFFLFNKNKKEATETVQTGMPNDVKAPQINKAAITLTDGSMVYLDSVSNGQLAMQGNVKLVKLTNGEIAYQTESSEVVKEIQYNTLSNPRGSKVIDMQLADGSHVWLNAGSSVTYPVAFVGNERKVSITGEAYFEVTHDATKPFYITKGDMQVQVLGTHFNVNAYDDEKDVKVTLLEGSVKVSNRNNERILKPGQQAQVATGIKVINKVDLETVMAWKNGLFAFDGYEDIQGIMRQLCRWYDLDVEYKGNITTMFGGSISRSENVSQALRMLEATGGVSFKVESRKIIVMPGK